MFAKLKQKIADEETSSDGNSSQPSSPQRQRKIKSKPRINGFAENKWAQRRVSTASLYESKESVFSDLSSTSGYVSRRQSFASRPSPFTPTWTSSDASNSSAGSGASRDEILALLEQRTEQVSKLEQKIQGMAGLLKEHVRAKENLEEKLEKQQKESSRKLLDLEEESHQRITKIKSDHEKALKQKSQESNRFEDLRELHGLQEQELGKMKSMFIQYQTDSTRKAAEILEKSKQLDNLDKEYAKQKNDLELLQERLDDLARERAKYEVREKQLQTKTTNLEKENTSLRDEINKTISDLTQKSLQLSRLEKSSEQTESELSSVRQSYTLYKNQTSAQLHEMQVKVDNLQERNGDLERRLQDYRLSGNDKYEAIERERQTLEERLSEARQQLIDSRTGSNDRINTLGSLVSTLNERLERKETALTECKRMHNIEIASYKEKILSLEDQLSSTKHLLQDKTSDSEKIQTLIKKNEQLERDLEQARLNLHGSSKSADEQISHMESEIHRLEETRIHEHNEVQKRMERLSEIEKEYSVRSDHYKLRIADLEEEKEQLQGELDSRTEELRQVSLCLEDAMTRTNELKSQIAIFEENLKTKDDILTGIKEKDSVDPHFLSMNSADAVNALRVDLDNFRMRCKRSEEALLEREKTILQLRNTLKDKEELINRSSTKLRQYEENNWLARNDKIYASDARDSHRVIAALRQQVKDLQQQQSEREMLQLDENELRELRHENRKQESELIEKEKKIKLLQAKLAELKKAFQRELKLSVPGEEVGHLATPDSPASDTSSAADKDRMEYLDMNFKYLKHVVLKYMCSDNKQSRQLINVISHMLRFSPKEQKCVQDASEWKLPLE